jgi:signal transduction histidine kinase
MGHAQLALRRMERTGELEPERIAQTLRAIEDQSDKLARLLGQLLDLSRLEIGKLELERQTADVVALVEQVVTGAQARGGSQTISVAAPRSAEADVDPLRIEQVLTNLLDNAIKYSPDGGSVEVVVSRSTDDALDMTVRDHGPGVPVEKRALIFERFYQAHGTGHKSGLGLGLYISREIVERHGGKIIAEFPEDGGSRFIVRLPGPASRPG